MHMHMHMHTHMHPHIDKAFWRYGKAWYYVIRPSLAMGIHTLGHTIRVCEGGGVGGREREGDKVVGMQLHVYIRRAMCMCVC